MNATEQGGSPKRQLVRARRELELQRTISETKRLRAETAAIEAARNWNSMAAAYVGHRDVGDGLGGRTGRVGIREGVYDGFTPTFVDPATPYYDSPGFHEYGGSGFGGLGSMPTDPEDFLDGRYRPFWVNLSQHRRLQGVLRYLAVGHPLGADVVRTICNYVVHKGYARDVKPKDRKDKSDSTASLIKEVKRVLEEFHERTKFKGKGEAEFVKSGFSSGEELLWIRHAGNGKAKIVDVPTEQLCEVQQQYEPDLEQAYDLPSSNWKFGVVTDLADTSDTRGYFWNRDHQGANYDFIPTTEAVFHKEGVPGNPSLVKRGLSPIYSVVPLMQLWMPAFVNVIVGIGLQSSIAYIRKATQPSLGSQGSITELGATGSVGPMIRGLGGRYENIAASLHSPGEIHDTQGVDYHAGPMGDSQAPFYIAGLDAVARFIGALVSMPEYLMSSIGSTTNRSTSETTEQGWLREVDRMQTMYGLAFREVDLRVLDIACRAGLFRRWAVRTLEDLLKRVLLILTPPPAKTKKRAEETTADQALVDAHAMSKQTFAERADVDWEEERDRLEKEKDDDVLNPEPVEMTIAGMNAEQKAAGGAGPAKGKPVRKAKPKARPQRSREHAEPASKPADDSDARRIREAASIIWGDYTGGQPSPVV